MNEQTIKLLERDLKEGLINQQVYDLNVDMLKKREIYHEASSALGDYFKKKLQNRIENATTDHELKDVEAELIYMADCVEKVLIFRTILFKRDELTGHIENSSKI